MPDGLVYYAKITNNKDREEVYINVEYGNTVSTSIMEPATNNPSVYVYTYKQKKEYNKYNLLIYQNDSMFGDSWYAYVYDDNGKIIKKITLKPF